MRRQTNVRIDLHTLPIPVAVLLVSFNTGSTAAGSNFQGLGHLGGNASWVTDISADGNTVVGGSYTDQNEIYQAFSWNATSDMQALGTLGGSTSQANAVSADGTVIVGTSKSVADSDNAFRWSASGGMQSLGVLDSGRSRALAVSADGSVVVGQSGKAPFPEFGCGNFVEPGCPSADEISSGTEQAFRWTAASGIQPIGMIDTGTGERSEAIAISGDATAVVINSHVYDCIVFVQHGGGLICGPMTPFDILMQADPMLAPVPLSLDGIANALSADASTIVGGTGSEAFRWTRTGGFEEITSNRYGFSAEDASADGGMIVGDFGLFHDGSTAAFKTIMMQLFSVDLTGWIIDGAEFYLSDPKVTVEPRSLVNYGPAAISDDGLVIAGTGINPLGIVEAFRAELDRLPTAAELDALPPFTFSRLYAAVLPMARAARVQQTVNSFVTIVNQGSDTAVDCRVGLATPVPASFDYHITDPLTNQTIGAQNTPVDIPAGGSQSFVIGITPQAAFPPTALRLSHDCVNTTPAVTLTGINDWIVSGSETAVPDLVALSATLTHNGIAELDHITGNGVFALASINLGSRDQITVRPDTGDLPLMAQICQTDPATATCITPIAEEITGAIGENETSTFSIFLTGNEIVAADFINNRVRVNFFDSSDVLRGATSVAVHTQIKPPGL